MTLSIDNGYEVLQDVHALGEAYEVFSPNFNPNAMPHCMSEFEPLPRLGHLQTLLSDQPFFGRKNRYFNDAPWWYRVRFFVPQDAPENAYLTIGAADYYCDVYLNGQLLGSHEGYFASFGFDVGGKLNRGEENLLVLKVSAPWDPQVLSGQTHTRFWDIVRHQMKGTYEHADTFVQRDINPIGLLKGAKLDFYESALLTGLQTLAQVSGDDGQLHIVPQVAGKSSPISYTLIDRETGLAVAHGQSEGALDLTVRQVKRWNCRGRGRASLYTLRAELEGRSTERTIGFRSLELRRDAEHTEYYLNGARIFLRGTTYFPDVYVSNMERSRYQRDLQTIIRAGMNAVRIHVHVEHNSFYELCDELGLLVIQDSDLNWVQERTDEFAQRAFNVFGEMLNMLGHHPCIATWICYNEPDLSDGSYFMNVQPGPQLELLAHQLTPGIPTIRGSYCADELHSGDSHNYRGSLNGENTHYLDTLALSEKFNTEFGIDAPGSLRNLSRIPALFNRLHMSDSEVSSIQYYQYRLIKFYIENYRIHKYHNCGGYVQFMFIDLCPQSFYGVYDYYGLPKLGLNALLESNQPLLAALECDRRAKALWVISDLDKPLDATLSYQIVSQNGELVERGAYPVSLAADSALRVCDFEKDLPDDATLILQLRDGDGKLLHENRYTRPLDHPGHPKGHPGRIDAELGMRLFHA